MNTAETNSMKNTLALFFAAAMAMTAPAFAQEKMTTDKMDKMDSKKSSGKMKKTAKMKSTDKMGKMDKTTK